MKVAILGANGFIGSRLVEQFHLGGLHIVIPIVRKASSLALPARFALDWRLGDALDLASLSKALEGCDAVIHAAIGDPRQIEKMPDTLCAAAAATGVKRVVYLSSASVHGQNIQEGTDESSVLRTDFPIEYNNAKVRAEKSFFAGCTQYRLNGYALRPGVVYGPRSRWIADLATELREKRAWLFENGKGICNSIYVDNLIHAAVLCLSAARGEGEAYLVSDAETVTWKDFYLCAARELNASDDAIQHIQRMPTFDRSFREKIETTVAQPWVQSLLPAVPFKLKRATKNLLASWNPPASPNAWSLPSRSMKPKITEEMALLQQNRWKIPSDKAANSLGYSAPVTFAEGMRRSFAWLRFATNDRID